MQIDVVTTPMTFLIMVATCLRERMEGEISIKKEAFNFTKERAAIRKALKQTKSSQFGSRQISRHCSRSFQNTPMGSRPRRMEQHGKNNALDLTLYKLNDEIIVDSNLGSHELNVERDNRHNLAGN